jgi:hypothetical protein
MNEIKVCCVPPAFKFKQLCFIDGGHNHSGGRSTVLMRRRWPIVMFTIQQSRNKEQATGKGRCDSKNEDFKNKYKNCMHKFLNATRYQLFHDFIRAAVNAGHSSISECFGDRIFPHESRTAMELQAFVNHLGV